MIEIQLSIYLWMKLAKIIIYFKNRFPIKLLLDTTFWKSFYEEKSDFVNFRSIKSLVYYYNVETETDLNRRIKLDPKIRQTNWVWQRIQLIQNMESY
jgi:hypothetical protein